MQKNKYRVCHPNCPFKQKVFTKLIVKTVLNSPLQQEKKLPNPQDPCGDNLCSGNEFNMNRCNMDDVP